MLGVSSYVVLQGLSRAYALSHFAEPGENRQLVLPASGSLRREYGWPTEGAESSI